jgi:hypothetical protein
VPIEEKDSYSDEELAELDLGELLAEGIRADDGRMRGDLQGVGSVAAAVQLEAAGVTAEEVGGAVKALREGDDPPEEPPAVAELVRKGLAASKSDEDRAMLVRWLGNVASLMLIRGRSQSTGPAGA